jgi:hypothetical protein
MNSVTFEVTWRMNLRLFKVAFPISFLSSLCMYAQVREVKESSDGKKARCPETQDKKPCHRKVCEVMRLDLLPSRLIAFIHCFMFR